MRNIYSKIKYNKHTKNNTRQHSFLSRIFIFNPKVAKSIGFFVLSFYLCVQLQQLFHKNLFKTTPNLDFAAKSLLPKYIRNF